jgi:autotransporter passenger strand-loop-strand repeat protein
VNNGTEVGDTVINGGLLQVTTDGLIVNTVASGDFSTIVVSGFFNGTLQHNAVTVGTSLFGVASSPAGEFVSAGGTAFQTTVNALAVQGVGGGTASNTTVNAGGEMFVEDDIDERPGTAFGTIVDGVGGLTANLFVDDGGHTFGTVVNFNGIEEVFGDNNGDGDPGTASGTLSTAAAISSSMRVVFPSIQSLTRAVPNLFSRARVTRGAWRSAPP